MTLVTIIMRLAGFAWASASGERRIILLISGLVWHFMYVYLVEYLQYLLKGWKGTSTHFAQGNFRYVSRRVLGKF
jgi:hypothetical protein